jgi:hypothetical protein
MEYGDELNDNEEKDYKREKISSQRSATTKSVLKKPLS